MRPFLLLKSVVKIVIIYWATITIHFNKKKGANNGKNYCYY